MDTIIPQSRQTITLGDTAYVFAVGWIAPVALAIAGFFLLMIGETVWGYVDLSAFNNWAEGGVVGWIDYIGIVLVLGCQFAAIQYFLIKKKRISWRAFGFRRPENKWLYSAVIAVVVLGLADVVLTESLHLTAQANAYAAALLLPANPTIADLLAAILFVGFATGILEECFFRGVLYRGIRNRFGIAPGLVLSAAIFSAVHLYFLDPGALLGWTWSGEIFVVGIVAAILVEKSGSLWPSIVFHAANNAAAVIILYWFL